VPSLWGGKRGISSEGQRYTETKLSPLTTLVCAIKEKQETIGEGEKKGTEKEKGGQPGGRLKEERKKGKSNQPWGWRGKRGKGAVGKRA